MDLRLRDKVVLLTGATGTLGGACARAFAAEGAQLALLGRRADALERLVAELRACGAPRCASVSADLGDADATDGAVAEVLRTFGRIDVLIACAGAAQGGVFTELSDTDWRRSLEIKLFGTIRVLRAVLPSMQRERRGRIVIVAGNSAKMPEPRMLPGAAANAALLAIVRGLAEELGPSGIAINAVNPGPIRSPRWEQQMRTLAARAGRPVEEIEAPFLAKAALRRLGSAEQVAYQVLFLASELADHTTGTSIEVDGGSIKTP